MPLCVEIKVQGRLNGQLWSAWFPDLTALHHASGVTVLRGFLADQAALYGVLSRLRDLAIPLISVSQIEPETQDDEFTALRGVY